jgi:hypothetical protein
MKFAVYVRVLTMTSISHDTLKTCRYVGEYLSITGVHGQVTRSRAP